MGVKNSREAVQGTLIKQYVQSINQQQIYRKQKQFRNKGLVNVKKDGQIKTARTFKLRIDWIVWEMNLCYQ